MGIAVSVELDTRQLEAWAAQTKRQMTSALRSAVDKSARYARRQTIPVMVADSGVPAGRFRAAVPTVQGSRLGGAIVATWAIGKSANNIRDASGRVPTPARGQAVQVSTFRVTGGGSANLTIAKGFTVAANGGRILMIRVGKGRNAIRAVYAEVSNRVQFRPLFASKNDPPISCAKLVKKATADRSDGGGWGGWS